MNSQNNNNLILGIIIPVHNGLEYTKVCLNSLKENIVFAHLNDSKVKIIVVDDGSADGTESWIKSNFPEVIILKGDGNLWWSGSINMGVRFAIEHLSCNFILWWNNDIRATNEYLGDLWNILHEININTIVGSKIYIEHNGKIFSMGGKFDPVIGEKYLMGFNENDQEDFTINKEADWFPGMGTCMHKSVYEDIGYLNNKDFPQYHGDSDFTYRAKLKGYILTTFPVLVLYNDYRNTGLKHQGNLKHLINTLISIKSEYNIRKDLKFYKLYATSYKAYRIIFKRYYQYIGGFLKWSFLSIFGIKKNESNALK